MKWIFRDKLLLPSVTALNFKRIGYDSTKLNLGFQNDCVCVGS